MSEPGGNDSVVERLRDLRRTLGLSQEQLARRLGVSFATVNRWESGRTQISAKAVAALAGLEADAAAGETGGNAASLPVARSSFVGRERELAELTLLLRQSRLVTLIGPGGAGKTRLAAQALSRRAVGDADVVLVALEQVRYPRTLASALASRLQVHDQQGTPLIESLQAALAAGAKSYDLLTAEQQGRLAMLSVFAGSFRMADAQAILGVDAPTAIATVRLLVDSSWLIVTRGAEQNVFSLLETIATFAAQQLDKSQDGQAARRRHALHFAGVAAESEQALAGPDAAGWAARLEAAVADLDLTMHWADEHGQADLGLNVSAALWRWWLFSGRLAVGRGWLARFLLAADGREDEVTGRAYCSAAVLAAENGDYGEAVRLAELAIAIFGPLDLKRRMTLAATVLGSANRYLGHHEGARRGFERAMELRDELGDRQGMSVAINNLALLELDDGNLTRAQELFEQALAIKREFGEQRSIAIGLANLADVLIRTRQWDAAEAVLAEGPPWRARTRS